MDLRPLPRVPEKSPPVYPPGLEPSGIRAVLEHLLVGRAAKGVDKLEAIGQRMRVRAGRWE